MSEDVADAMICSVKLDNTTSLVINQALCLNNGSGQHGGVANEIVGEQPTKTPYFLPLPE